MLKTKTSASEKRNVNKAQQEKEMCENIYFRGILIELLVTKEPKDGGENCGMFLFLGKQKELSPGYRKSVTNLSRGYCGR